MAIDKPIVEITNSYQDGRLPQYYNVKLFQISVPKQLYSYNIDITICSADEMNIATKMTSKVLFSVEKDVIDRVTRVVFEVMDTTVQNANPEGQKIAEMGKLFAMPINRLILDFNNKGELKDVMNTTEILQKWEELFKGISEGMDESTKKQIKDGGDKDFRDPLKSLRSSFLHSILFPPLYRATISSYETPSFDLANNLKLIQGEQIDLHLRGTVKYLDKDTLNMGFMGHVEDKSGLLKAAKKLYQNMVPDSSKFTVDFSADYVIDIQSGIPVSITSTYLETVEGVIKYKQYSEIKILS